MPFQLHRPGRGEGILATLNCVGQGQCTLDRLQQQCEAHLVAPHGLYCHLAAQASALCDQNGGEARALRPCGPEGQAQEDGS